jgi:Ni,Fe-hydrogenase III small subunit
MRTPLLRALFQKSLAVETPSPDEAALAEVGRSLAQRARRLFGRSVTICEVDAGSCNGCELEIQALTNPIYDVERFGIAFAASPRHADALLVTGPVSLNMKAALERAYEAMPDPKWVIAAGDCAAGCGVFAASAATAGSVAAVLPVDLHIRGCPPRPLDLLKGLLALTHGATD